MSYTILHFQKGESPLFIACLNNHGKIVDHLLSAKADVNLKREVGIAYHGTVIIWRSVGRRPLIETKHVGTGLPPYCTS